MKKITLKLTAVILTLVICLSVCVPGTFASRNRPEDVPEMESLDDFREYLSDGGHPTFTTDEFMHIYDGFGFIFRLLTGRAFAPAERFKVSVDPFITAVCNGISEETGFDIVTLITNLPESNQIAELAVKVFNIDPVSMREQTYAKANECFETGDALKGNFYHLMGAFFSIIDNAEIYSEDYAADPALKEVLVRVTFRDGEQELLHPGIFINPETGWCGNINGGGLLDTGFEYDLDDLLVYATINCWMRNFGFTMAYDIFCYIMPMWNYRTRRFKFDYAGKEWMIQIWKGNYLITNGGELGLYNREPGSLGTFYNCATDDELLEMTMQIWHGDELLVDLGPTQHWWINGFQMKDTMFRPNTLTMKASVVMRDEEMLAAFTEAIEKNYRHDVSYTVDGLTVSIEW